LKEEQTDEARKLNGSRQPPSYKITCVASYKILQQSVLISASSTGNA